MRFIAWGSWKAAGSGEGRPTGVVAPAFEVVVHRLEDEVRFGEDESAEDVCLARAVVDPEGGLFVQQSHVVLDVEDREVFVEQRSELPGQRHDRVLGDQQLFFRRDLLVQVFQVVQEGQQLGTA